MEVARPGAGADAGDSPGALRVRPDRRGRRGGDARSASPSGAPSTGGSWRCAWSQWRRCCFRCRSGSAAGLRWCSSPSCSWRWAASPSGRAATPSSTLLISGDRALTGTVVPVWLQQHLPALLGAPAAALTAVYLAHYVAPLAHGLVVVAPPPRPLRRLRRHLHAGDGDRLRRVPHLPAVAAVVRAAARTAPARASQRHRRAAVAARRVAVRRRRPRALRGDALAARHHPGAGGRCGDRRPALAMALVVAAVPGRRSRSPCC